MVIRNINTDIGLYNGRVGTVKDILYYKGSIVHGQMPLGVVMYIQNLDLPQNLCFNKEEGCVLITPIEIVN